jgi:RNA polymerase sigma-70 factor (ECF subfamily)
MTFFRGRPDRLQDFRAGRRAVLEELYWAYVDRVERIVRHGFYRVGSGQVSGVASSEVRDVIQEIFSRAFRERARLAYDGVREYSPFIATIARNVVTDWARRRGHAIVELSDDLDDAPAEDVELAWADEAVMRVVDEYLSHLDPELTRLLEQRYVLGLSQNDAARALGISRQQFRSRDAKLRAGLVRAIRRANLAKDLK